MRREYPSLTLGLVGAWCPSLSGIGVALRDFSAQRNHAFFTGASPLSSFLTASTGGVALSASSGGAVTSSVVPRLGFVSTAGSVGAVTMAAWIRPSLLLSNGFILAFDSVSTREIMLYSENDQLAFASLDGAASIVRSQSVLTTGQWQHVCAVVSGTAVSFFRNGIAVGTATQTGLLRVTQKAYIGSRQYTNAEQRFQGLIDDVRMYGRALTAAEVTLLSSRPGIGLAPQRQRRASVIGSRFSVNVAGTWRDAVPWANVAGVWKQATPSTKNAGTWK